jgi:DNA modification methylase
MVYILDPFVGSGTTLLAAADLQRNGIGYEINPEIAFIAVQN